jgi:acetyltransferase
LRRIRADDAQALQAFMAALSERSAHHRFLASVHQLSEKQLRRFTQIEDERECAMVALDTHDSGAEGAIVGSARYLIESTEGDGPVRAEFAVTVADAWQGFGLGKVLMHDLLSAARARGITRIEGHVLAENTQMLHLARRLGFSVQPEPGDAALRQVVLEIRHPGDNE